MPFDFVASPVVRSRAARGRGNNLAGHAAEASVARLYEARGVAICARNWRGSRAEIDLVGRQGDTVVFIEVKQSRTHDLAASHISQAQIARIFAAVEEFVAGEPNGLLTDVRIDLALVDGQGRIEVLENAFAG
ncbi:MAG: YraN family protein [Tabrizicola sp.]|uniref:YraN family protein n=1 Tax=Tabrizicola sp. TaxID=2005166 RepID=UPI00273500A5|nr:YraN family protein [Tabrizicola sp.]MDP3264840.1 YraN family protein [Tabrizicola sp.]MDP3647575.1 YraN family protein [Paracoccaceae bacterium]